ncbi:MAG: hypothetical protein ABIC68_06810 [Candidatus Omnitrophota bacterium]
MFIVEQISSRLKPKCDILALGVDTAQRVSFSKKGKIFELRPRRDFTCSEDFYDQMVAFLWRKVKAEFHVISFDPHPLLASRAFSAIIKKKYYSKAKLVPIWHHVAHAASFGYEADKSKNYIGIVFDGTGYGKDGHVWGGEFFVHRGHTFLRAAHFQYQPLCGNELAIKEPWRFAFGVLYGIYGLKDFPFDLACFKGVKKDTFKLFAQMVDKGFNTPLVSSVGRLFDAVSALLSIKTIASKEAEAAIALEKAGAKYRGCVDKAYSFKIKKQGGCFCVEPALMFEEIIRDLRRGLSVERIAYQFHVTLAEMMRQVCLLLSKEYKIKKIYCSGGVFMNNILCSEAKRLFEKEDLKLYFALRPLNTDLGISRGQIAACMMEKLCV